MKSRFTRMAVVASVAAAAAGCVMPPVPPVVQNEHTPVPGRAEPPLGSISQGPSSYTNYVGGHLFCTATVIPSADSSAVDVTVNCPRGGPQRPPEALEALQSRLGAMPVPLTSDGVSSHYNLGTLNGYVVQAHTIPVRTPNGLNCRFQMPVVSLPDPTASGSPIDILGERASPPRGFTFVAAPIKQVVAAGAQVVVRTTEPWAVCDTDSRRQYTPGYTPRPR